jgi:type IV secretion system protein TrbL
MKPTFLKPLIGVCLLLATATAQAAIPGIDSAGLFDKILQQFATTASGWGDKMVEYASWLFWSLTLLSMVWTYGLMALKKADIQEFFAETIRFFAVTGFFLWILRNGPALSMAIIDTLRQVASSASGLSKNISPSGVVDVGFDITSKVADMSSIWSPAVSIVGLAIAAIILVIFALISVNMLLMLISAWLLAYAGVFLLGFGGGRWTQDIAIQYYKTVLSVALQTFTMILIVGIGHSFIDEYYAAMGNEIALKELFVMLVLSIIILNLTNKLPPMMAGIVGGAGGGGASGIGNFGAGAAMGALGMAASMAASAGSMAMGAASSMAGGASAIQAAFQAAQQGMSAAGGGSSGGSGGGLAAAMGTAGRFAADMGASLAKGAAQTMGDKMDGMKEAAQERVSNTLGGKIASAIKNAEASSEAQASGASSQSASNDNFDGNSLSAGQSDEVAHFVNKSTSTEQVSS